MRVEREEVPFCTISFKCKANEHQAFDKSTGHIVAQPGIKDLFKDLGIIKAIAQVG